MAAPQNRYSNTTDDLLHEIWDGIGNGLDQTATGKVDKIGADDIEITDANKGLILVDRTTAIRYRLFVDDGVLGIEAVV